MPLEPAERLVFDIAYAIGRARRGFTDAERRVLASSIIEHLRRCGWSLEHRGGIAAHGSAADWTPQR